MVVNSVQNRGAQTSFRGISGMRLLEKASGMNSWQQRAILGVAACTFQPAIDRSNTAVDPETRRCSANRSFAKALVGAATGVAVRAGCMVAIKPLLKRPDVASKLASYMDNVSAADISGAKCGKYAAVIGTIVALGVMLVTNFLIDGPMTVKLTDYLNEKDAKKNNENDTFSLSNSKKGGA